MRAQQIQSLDGPAGLQLVELDEPDGDRLVIIDVAAAGVSFPDLLLSRGLYQTKPALPFSPGLETAAAQLGDVRARHDQHARSPHYAAPAAAGASPSSTAANCLVVSRMS